MRISPLAMLAVTPFALSAPASAGPPHRSNHDMRGHALHAAMAASHGVHRTGRWVSAPLAVPAFADDAARGAADWSVPGAVVEAATRRARHEPGLTLELSPYAKETATGGPAGGVPGFDGS